MNIIPPFLHSFLGHVWTMKYSGMFFSKALKLDDAVHRIVDGPPFDGQIDIERVGEGRYRIDGKLIFVRVS